MLHVQNLHSHTHTHTCAANFGVTENFKVLRL